MTEAKPESGSQTTIKIESLFSDQEETLWGQKPSIISEIVQKKLNEIGTKGQDIVNIITIPDYHTMGGDGGIKDILFLTQEVSSSNTSDEKINWETTTVLQNDEKSMYGVKTDQIKSKLEKRVTELLADSNKIGFILPITDSNAFTRYAGPDGLKDFIICYHR